MHIRSRITEAFHRLWWGFRQVMGDAAYDRYLARMARGRHRPGCHQAAKILSREEFYLDGLRRRYSGISRCC